jgi:hypothetical protein
MIGIAVRVNPIGMLRISLLAPASAARETPAAAAITSAAPASAAPSSAAARYHIAYD